MATLLLEKVLAQLVLKLEVPGNGSVRPVFKTAFPRKCDPEAYWREAARTPDAA
jgi:hypothetical protein